MSKSIIEKLQEIADNPPSDASNAHYSKYAEEALELLRSIKATAMFTKHHIIEGNAIQADWGAQDIMDRLEGLEL